MSSLPDRALLAQVSPRDPGAPLAALICPPAACPGCVALAGQSWPANTTSRFCASCLARLVGAWRLSQLRAKGAAYA